MSEPEATDEDLLERARSGDSRAFDLFLRRHSGRVFRWMVRAAGESDAEDLTQEIFLKAYRGLARYRGDAPAQAWLAAIAHNTLKNRYRFRARFGRIFARRSDDDPPPEPVSDERDPESKAQASEHRRFVAEALTKVPEEFRMPVVLRDIEGWNYEEIAVSLGLPVGTVKSRIARGRGQLRTILAPILRREAP